jgi:monoamine oxidase
MGYINFGVCPDIQSDVDLTPDTRGTVIVVGAGCAGLSTARQLRSWGYRVIVVEGRNRPGGRVFTSRLSAPASTDNTNGENTAANSNDTTINAISNSAAVVADVGGSIITGIDGNPLAILTKQLKIPLSHIRDRAPIFMPDGSPANDVLDSAVEKYYNHSLMKGCNGLRAIPQTVEGMSLQGALEKLWGEQYGELERLLPEIKLNGGVNGIDGNSNNKKVPSYIPSGGGSTVLHNNGSANGIAVTSDGIVNVKKLDQYPLLHPTARKARQLFEWHLANLEFANACKLDTCSLLHWDQDDPFELPGAHCFVPGCNGRWVQALAKGIPIMYNHPVSEVRYCKTGVAVHTANSKVLHADAVVVTAPLGVLKRGGIAFNPPLSEHKRGAISRLGFGNLNKVILMFPKVFWSEDEDMFGHVAEDPASRGEAFLFYSYAHISGGAQLTALIAGSAAEEHEKRSAHDSVTRVMAILRSIFEPKGVVVPPPLQAMITRWGSDPMAYGAYSSLPVGSHGGEDYDIMAKSVGGRLFFAGEATTRRYPATMHGAFFTGLWAAADVDAALSKAKAEPQFSNKVSAEVVEAVTRAEEEKRAAREAASLAAMAAKKPPRPPSALGGVVSGSGGYTYYNGNGVLKPTSPEEQALLDKLVNEKLVLSSRLKMLFDDPEHPPDLEVGSFKAVYGAPGSHVAHQALLRIDISSARGKFSKEEREGTRQVNLYCVVLKDTAMAVAEQTDNYARVALLGSLPSVKLVERTGLGPEAVGVMDSVMRWRRKKEMMLETHAMTAAAAGGGIGWGNSNGPGGVFNEYSALPPPQIQQQQQQQVPMFAANPNNTAAANGNGSAAPVANAVPNGSGSLESHRQQQQYPQQEIINDTIAAIAAAVQKVQQSEAAAAALSPPPALPVPVPPTASVPAPVRPRPAFSALDIALGLAVSDIVDLTGDD